MALGPDPDPTPVVADLTERGYRIDRPDGWNTPTVVARDGETPPPGAGDAPLAVEPLAAADPLTVVSRLADAAEAGRSTLFVADADTAAAVADLLADPFLLAGETPDGRVFRSVPDRILLTDDSYACVRTDAALRWREEGAGGTDTERGDPETAPRLVLEAGDEVVAVLDSVDGLTCPGPEPAAFRHRYRREDDKRIHVYDADGEVGRYNGVAAMKANAYRPVPLPLVPEHHLRTNARLARAWSVAIVENEAEGGIRYLSPGHARE
jgi:hypothetical protein